MEKKDEFNKGDKIMGLGKIPGVGGYTLAGGDIIGYKEDSYIVNPESELCIESSILIKKNLASIFNKDAWNRSIGHWNCFWNYGYTDEEADNIPEDIRSDIDTKASMEFLRSIRSLNGFNDENLEDDELIQKATSDRELRLPKLVVTIKNGLLT